MPTSVTTPMNTPPEDIASLRLTCPDCGWSGMGSECDESDVAEGVTQRACPTCARILTVGERIFAWVLEQPKPAPEVPGPPGGPSGPSGEPDPRQR
jgi:predicted RNA-binding Zn-ribbon protein involved in translation (DUF1610 family)